MKPTRLQELQWYYNATRRMGHTTLMIEGIHFGRPGVLLFGSNMHAQAAFREAVERYHIDRADFANMKIHNIRFATIHWLNNLQENMRGRKFEDMPAVVVDHFAMSILLDEHEKKLEEFWSKNNA